MGQLDPGIDEDDVAVRRVDQGGRLRRQVPHRVAEQTQRRQHLGAGASALVSRSSEAMAEL